MTVVRKNEIYRWENPVFLEISERSGHCWYTNFWVPTPPSSFFLMLACPARQTIAEQRSIGGEGAVLYTWCSDNHIPHFPWHCIGSVDTLPIRVPRGHQVSRPGTVLRVFFPSSTPSQGALCVTCL